jgi:murein DD-endopeptidase MepM/ murein hydrolase activator NlpD
VAGDVQTLEDLSAQEEAQLESLVRAQQAELERERAQGRAAILPAPGGGQLLWPLHGPITSPFGMRLNPFGGGHTEFHPGIDIAVDVGTPVAAAATGRVIIAGWVSGYGNYVAIDHGGGISTGYGHLSQIDVSTGEDVQAGQVVGMSGNTGRSTGPHLIFEVRRNGTPVDPNPFLR